ncbi:NADH-quinone oxidoreductase subunit NuoG [Buchnera aphidicola]|uniref:NADH-quinone oxidoreductase subunit NuoG n=1 Tax=Buchnera aphidicola TaxID=9 RepID=UPI0031B865B4
MAIMLIDKEKYRIDLSKNILQNCLLNNINLPYFCWHPILGSVGSCRQCAVKHVFLDDNGVMQSRIIMSCMTKPENNMKIFVNDYEVYKFRKSIIEFLMLNHPHDCPICSEGGSCHLQDMTVIAGHNMRKYRYKKRVYKNQYLGKFISHKMNRCISCYRCVRFYKDYADGKDFDVYGISNNLYFGRVEDGDLESEHSGNLVEICPTGVFTDKLYNNNYSRKWDMQNAPSVCNFCSIGCNIIGSERLGTLRKIENRYHGDINRYFICDLGRFGNNFINKDNIPLYPFFFKKNKKFKLTVDKAIEKAKNILVNSNKILGIGSVRSSIENNFSLLNLVGKKNFSNGMIKEESDCINVMLNFLKKNSIKIPSLREIENCDLAIIIGQDITITAPRMSLSIRQSVKNQIKKNYFNFKQVCKSIKISYKNKIFNNKDNSSIFILSNDFTKLDDISKLNYYSDYEDQAKFLFFLKNIINGKKIEKCDFFISIEKKLLYISEMLLKSKNPVFILSLNDNNLNLTKSFINFISVLQKININVGIVFLTQSANSISNAIMSKISLNEILKVACIKDNIAIILMETDLYRLIPEKIIRNIFKRRNKIIVLDHLNTNSMNKFTLSLPTKSFLESSGTIINYEIRSQKYFKIFDKKVHNEFCFRMESWKWLKKIYYKINKKVSKCNNLKNILNLCIKKIPDFIGIEDFLSSSNIKFLDQKVPRYANRASGRTMLRSKKEDFKKNIICDSETIFSFSMEGYQNFNNKIEHIPFVWNPGINSSQAWNNISKKNFFSGKKLLKSTKKRKNINYKIVFKNKINKKRFIVTKYNMLFASEEMSQFSNFMSIKDNLIPGFFSFKYIDSLKLKEKSIFLFRFNSKNFKIVIYFSKFLKYGYISLPIGSFGIPVFLNGYEIKKFKII